MAKEERKRKKHFSKEEDAIIKSAFFVHTTEDNAIEAIIQEEIMKQGEKDTRKVMQRARTLGLVGEKEEEKGEKIAPTTEKARATKIGGTTTVNSYPNPNPSASLTDKRR